MKRILVLTALVVGAAAIFAAPVPPVGKGKLPETDEALPATDADREKVKNASSKNVMQIMNGVHNFASAEKDRLPRDIYDKDGKPLLSWRVAILPYLEQEPLFKLFKLDEPWDSPNNIKLLDKMPAVYDSPRARSKLKGFTVYQTFMGNGAVPNSMFSVGNIPDGTSNTIWCVEATAAVPWTKPVHIPFEPEKDLPKFGKAFGEKPLVGMCDGSVRFVDLKKVSAATLKNAISGNEGNVLGADWE
jgi:hypothetical protein